MKVMAVSWGPKCHCLEEGEEGSLMLHASFVYNFKRFSRSFFIIGDGGGTGACVRGDVIQFFRAKNTQHAVVSEAREALFLLAKYPKRSLAFHVSGILIVNV